MLGDYDPNLVHYNWHWFWKTGNGDLNNQGTHQLDVAAHFEKLHAIMRDGVGIPEHGSTYRLGPTLTFDPTSPTRDRSGE